MCIIHNQTYIVHVGYNLYNPKQTEVASPSPTHPTCNCPYKPLTDCIERPSSHLEISIISLLGRFLLETPPPTQQNVLFFWNDTYSHIVIWTLHIYIYICHEGIRHVFKKNIMNIPLIDYFPFYSHGEAPCQLRRPLTWRSSPWPYVKHATPGHIIQLIHDS